MQGNVNIILHFIWEIQDMGWENKRLCELGYSMYIVIFTSTEQYSAEMTKLLVSKYIPVTEWV
jgi:hypothetical protein